MTAKVYQLFKKTNPRIRTYERDKKGKVLIGAMCSIEHEKILEELTENVKKETVEIVLKTEETIYFTVICNDYEFTDRIIKDFF